MSKPIVTAKHVTEYRPKRPATSFYGSTLAYAATPGVHVELTFELHDHESALAFLEAAVEDIRAQIEETDQ